MSFDPSLSLSRAFVPSESISISGRCIQSNRSITNNFVDHRADLYSASLREPFHLQASK